MNERMNQLLRRALDALLECVTQDTRSGTEPGEAIVRLMSCMTASLIAGLRTDDGAPITGGSVNAIMADISANVAHFVAAAEPVAASPTVADVGRA